MPLLHAHRGAASERPENTVPSFERALEHGADGLETDLHLTSDGHVVASHDPSLMRMSGAPVVIRRETLTTVQGHDVGWGFVDASGARPFAAKGFRVPTFEELLDAFPTTPWNVDIKQHERAAVDAVLSVIRRKRAEDRVLVASFDAATLRAVRRAGYAGRTGMGVADVLWLLGAPLALLRHAPPAGTAAQVPPRLHGLRSDTRSFVAKCKALSLRLDYWTINDPSEAERLIALGADGIMTDDPGSIGPVFRRLRASQK